MKFRSVLLFEVGGASFGVDTEKVLETVWLPELAPVEEAPPWVVGLFNLRGRIVPVADPGRRFGQSPRPYRTTDQVIVLELKRRRMGLIISRVDDVVEIPVSEIQPPPQFADGHERPVHLIEGEANVDGVIVSLLDVEQLVLAPAYQLPPGQLEAQGGEGGADVGRFCPGATAEERALFRKRADALRESGHREEGGRLGLAVVEIEGECFGLELEAVQEFCKIKQCSPIPCCPSHILGVISLRGRLYTLLDLRGALNLPRNAHPAGKAVVARQGGQAVGLAVDEVHDVVYTDQEELMPVPVQLLDQHAAEIKGTLPWNGRTLAVLDLPTLLAREEWTVNETV